jgi:hypothetical protein
MHRFLLTTARLALAAWVGGAALFVITGVREVTTSDPHLNQSAVKDALVAVRFPAYYAFGFTLLAVALACIAALPRMRLLPTLRRWLLLLLPAAALLLMIADYVWVYRPLEAMVTPPGKARPAEFVEYHAASKWINAAGLGVSLLAAVLVSWPVRIDEPRVES